MGTRSMDTIFMALLPTPAWIIARLRTYELPLILLMGSEREGLTPDQSAVCDAMLSIPMQGRVTSLNLAIATGVMLYSILNKL